MKSNLTPFYLSSLVPQNVGSVSRYNLRNADNLYTINTRTNQYFLSFLPSVVRDWNDLPVEAKQIETVNSFKNFLNRNRSYVPRHYYTGKRKQQVLHTRLRTNCSALNYDLYLKDITDSPLCRCGSIENTYHFFLQCPHYLPQRIELTNAVSQYYTISLDLLLCGNASLSHETNSIIFQKVQKYITDTKRFT